MTLNIPTALCGTRIYTSEFQNHRYSDKTNLGGYKEKYQGDLEIRYTIWDIDGDSQPELIVTTRTCDADNTAYEYSYTYGNMTVDRKGSILLSSQSFPWNPEERSLIRLVFDGDESFIQYLPLQYYFSIC